MVRAVWRRFSFKLNTSKLALTPDNLAALYGSEVVETEIQRLRQLIGIGSKFYAYAKAGQIMHRAIMHVVPEDEDLARVVNLRPLQASLFHLRPSSLALPMSSPAPVFATFRPMQLMAPPPNSISPASGRDRGWLPVCPWGAPTERILKP
jgi:hypothetical protein